MPASFRVLITDRAWPDLSVERAILEPVGAELIDAPGTDEATLLSLVKDAAAVGTCWAKITPPIIRAARKCRVIARFGIGLDNICLETAQDAGIPVTNVPDYCVEEVSDHALGLLLNAARKLSFYDRLEKAGTPDLQAGPPMRRLSRCTLGLAGFGRTARALYPKARALGMRVIAWNRSGSSYGTDCKIVSLESLLGESDFISLHLPLTEETRDTFQRTVFEQMKPGAVLINCARAEIVVADDLLEALTNGRLGGAALDVAPVDHPVTRHPLVTVTPHAAFLSEESLAELRRRASEEIARGLAGADFKCRVV